MSSPSHEIILTSSPDGPITVYDTISGATITRFKASLSPRHGLALAGNLYIAASHISSSTASASIRLYNWWSPAAFHHLHVPEPVAPLVATPDGAFLFAGGLSGEVHALSLPSGNILSSFRAHTTPVSCLRISSDFSLLISGGDDGVIAVAPILQLVDAHSNMDQDPSSLILHRFVAHDGPVTDITCFPGLSQSTILSCSTDCTCKLWNLLSGNQLRTITFPCPISCVILDPTCKEFYAAGSDGLIYKGLLTVDCREEARQDRELTTWSQKHGAGIVSMVMVNEAKNLVSAAEDGSIYIWKTDGGQVVRALGNNMESVSDVLAVSGMGGAKGSGVKVYSSEAASGSGDKIVELSGKRVYRSAKDEVVLEDVLTVAAKDRSKAIDMLETAIGVYEKLLELIVKEARRRNSKNC